MNSKEFRAEAHRMADWMADYLEQVGQYPVKAQVGPGDIKAQLPPLPPADSESMTEIMKDVETIIMPGITHWESPGFMAYFPASKSPPSILAEMLTASLGVQGMLWLTSPAATELEEHMMEWLKHMLALPEEWKGVIQDTASTATLTALLTAREKALNWEGNRKGLQGGPAFRVYASDQVHSSIDKDVQIAGIGLKNLVKIPTDEHFALRPDELEKAIKQDLEKGYHPLCVISAMGTTSSTALDPIGAIGHIANRHDLWHHVDAAYAGTALLLPECRYMADGLELADSFVFNPHKWMFVNFDCSVYYVKDAEALKRTFSINPEYLKTKEDEQVTNYRDWHIQLGRRFRALKLWFVIRSYGIEGLQAKIRKHIDMGQWLKIRVEEHPDFELLAPVPLNLVCFRYHPEGLDEEEKLDALNESLMHRINAKGKFFFTHTRLEGKFTLRLVPGNEQVDWPHVEQAWQEIVEEAPSLKI